MFEELYAPLPDPEKYLERIGLAGEKPEPTAKWLDRLVVEQLYHIPFDDLDVFADGAWPSLAVEDMFDKIIVRKRGGYCYELNSLFKALLLSLGYEAYTVIVHLMGDRDYIGIPSHCAIVVRIDGKKYFLDVGYGGRVPNGAVAFDGELHHGYRIGRQEMYTRLDLVENGESTRVMLFKDMPALPVELMPLNYHTSQNPTSMFRHRPMLQIRYPDGSAALTGREFKYHRGDVRINETLEGGAEEIGKLAQEYFGIPDAPVRDFED